MNYRLQLLAAACLVSLLSVTAMVGFLLAGLGLWLAAPCAVVTSTALLTLVVRQLERLDEADEHETSWEER